MTIASTITQTKNERILGKVVGSNSGPTVLFLAGIHGNEKAGVKALQRLFPAIEKHSTQLSGTVLGIAGNLQALELGVRFQEKDLNRLWDSETIKRIQNSNADLLAEEKELAELYREIIQVLRNQPPPIYIIDLHTTSGPTCPFILINDSLLNRAFISHYSYPVILGIEEHLGTTLLSYLNDLGYVSFGFESGQHTDPAAVDNAILFIERTLKLTGSIPEEVRISEIVDSISGDEACDISGFFEIYHLHKIRKDESFRMISGFKNFEHVPAGVALAKSDGKTVTTDREIQLFMPLYQKKGTSGYYFIRRIPPLFMRLSKWFRQSRLDRILVLLPGIRWGSENRDTLIINLKVARFMAKPIFHLLGYRAKTREGHNLVVKNRERGSRKADYYNEPWY